MSGPIAGHPDLNEPMFRAAQRRLNNEMRRVPLKKWDYDHVLVPHDIPPHHHEDNCPTSYVQNGAHSAACYLRADILEMLKVATDVWFLPGWEASVGARLEMQVAAACGLGIKFFHRQELGCAHNGHGWGKCDEAGCWNYRKPLDMVHTKEEIDAAIRRPHERPSVIAVNLPADPLGPTMLGPCAHRPHGTTTRCAEMVCPNYYGRHMA